MTATGAERAPDRERADVAHEDLRRIGVEPEESQAGAVSAPQNTSSSPTPPM
jgi:hypothetical protein